MRSSTIAHRLLEIRPARTSYHSWAQSRLRRFARTCAPLRFRGRAEDTHFDKGNEALGACRTCDAPVATLRSRQKPRLTAGEGTAERRLRLRRVHPEFLELAREGVPPPT